MLINALIFTVLVINNTHATGNINHAVYMGTERLITPSGHPNLSYPQRSISKSIKGKKYHLVFIKFLEKCKKQYDQEGEQCVVKGIYNKKKYRDYQLYPFEFPYHFHSATGIWSPLIKGRRLFNPKYTNQTNHSLTVNFQACRECDMPNILTALFEKNKSTKKWHLIKLD
jgi:hypothetical protein